MGFWKQFCLIVRKNFVLHRRQPLRITVEVVWPLVLFIILAAVRTRPNLMIDQPECHFDAKAMPSAGFLPFVRSILCSWNNTCYQEQRESQYGLKNDTLADAVNDAFDAVNAALSNDTLRHAITRGLAEASRLTITVDRLRKSQTAVPLSRYIFNSSDTVLRLANSSGIPIDNATVRALLTNVSLNISRIVASLPYVAEVLTANSSYLSAAGGGSYSWPRLFDLARAAFSGNFSSSSPIASFYDVVSQAVSSSTFSKPGSMGTVSSSNFWVTSDDMLLPANGSLTSPSLVKPDALPTPADPASVTLSLLSEHSVVDVHTSAQPVGYASRSTYPDSMASTESSRAYTGNSTSVLPGIKRMLCGNESILVPTSLVGEHAIAEVCSLSASQLFLLSRIVASNVDTGLLLAEILPLLPDPRALADLRTAVEDLFRLPAVGSLLSRDGGIVSRAASDLFCSSNVSDWLAFGDSNGNWTVLDNSTAFNDSTISNQSDSSSNNASDSVLDECIGRFAPLGNIMFRQLEPLLFGKIPYAPSSLLTDTIVGAANGTFQTIADLAALTSFFADASSVLLRNLGPLAEWLDQLATMLDRLAPADPSAANLAAMLRAAAEQLQQNGTLFKDLATASRVTSAVAPYLRCFMTDKFEPWPDEASLVNRSLELIDSNRYWAALVFNDASLNPVSGRNSSNGSAVARSRQQRSDSNGNGSDMQLPSYVSYKIRMNTDRVDNTRRIEDRYWRPLPRRNPVVDLKYITYGFAYIQDMVEHAIISLHAQAMGSSAAGRAVPMLAPHTGIYLQQFPYPCYIQDNFATAVSRTMPLFMVLAWLFSVAMTVKGVVYEKQERLREAMKIVGLTPAAHWTAWFVSSFSVMTASVVLLVFLVKYGRVIEMSDPSVVLVFMLCFVVATISQAFLLSTFFVHANLAACCAAVVFFCLYLPYTLLVQWEEVLSTSEKSLACLLSSVAFGFGCSYLARYEEQGVGAQWSNVAVSPIADDGFSLLRCMMMMLLDAAVYLVLLWYIENVFPGKYGVPKPWYFLFTRSHWNCRRRTLDRALSGRSATYRIGETCLPQQQHSPNEAEPCSDGTLGVCIQKLRKVYSNGKKVAIDGLTLNFYEDQITSFLGHNGAGKTTTMSILCGLFPPTSGTAVIYGRDITQDMDEIRKSLGFCPQHNILFDNLTVEEHILFYAQLKGEDLASARAEMESMLVEVGLKPKQHELARNLSGGMKRKLSVMMSFVGGSKCVILDEPTAGVDPYSRRQIWELLLKFKKGRTVILSTHHMDEADFLGDRIAIISLGKLCCVGSSLYLKSRYGSGYYLTIILNDAVGSPSAPGASRAEHVIKFVTERVSEAQLTAEHRSELCIQLPSSGTRDGSFSCLFKDLDANMEALGIRTYGISDTTLEEIFLKVADESGLDMEESLQKLTDGGQLPRPPSRLSVRSRGLRGVLRKLRERLTSTKQLCTQHFAFSGSVQMEDERSRQQWPEELPMAGDVVPTFSVSRSEALPADLPSSGLAPFSASVNGLDRRSTAAFSRGAAGGEVLSDASVPNVVSSGTANAVVGPVDDARREHSSHSSPRSAIADDSLVTAATTRTRSSEDIKDGHAVDTDDDADGGDDEFVDSLQQNLNNSSAAAATCREPCLSTAGMTSSSKLLGARLRLQQFRALIIKRFHHVRRNKKAFFCEILLPAVFITLALAFALILPPIDEAPPLELQPWMYQPRVGSPHLTAFYSNDAGSSAFAKELEQLVREGQYGTRCMEPSVYTIDGRPCTDYSGEPDAQAWTAQPSVPRYEDLPTCSCDTGFQQCPANASGPAASRRLLNNTDYMLNMTGRNLSDWLVKTMQPYIKRRYGGFSFEAVLQRAPDQNLSFISDVFRSVAQQAPIEPPANAGAALQRILSGLSSRNVAKVWFDNKGWASSVSYMNAMNNVLLRVLARENGLDPRQYGVTAINHPMKMTDGQLIDSMLNRGWVAVVISICVIFAMSLIPATFVLYLIEDRQSTSKHLQFVSGMSRTTYWFGSYSWDMLNYVVAGSICLVIFVAFNEQEYVSPTNAPCLVVLLLTYGWAMVPAMYPFSFVFSVPSTAFVVLSCLNIFLGVTSTLATFILEMFPDDPYLNDVGHTLRSVFLILPHYCLGRGLIDISVAHVKCQAFTSLTGEPCSYDPFEWTMTGRNIMALCVMGVLYFALILFIEHWSSSADCCLSCAVKRASKSALRATERARRKARAGDEEEEEEMEEDVQKERLRVLNGLASEDVLRVDSAVKAYRTATGKTHVAVDGLTFGVRRSECFGLLGVNGAGKTSTFKMLTGETNFTGGNAFVNHHSVRTNIAAVYEDLGYCPQFDALDLLLTGRQHLEFYARLRGVPERQVAGVADHCISRMNFKRYQDKIVGSYSGGNKRKLQAAIALIGNPAAVFLDEPTTGMDPKARRFLWNCIKGMVHDGRAVVLTSHSMEECEALCQRIGIMVNGRFRCMGSSQHLKNKYGSGYVLSLRAAAGSASAGELLALKRAIHDRFCGRAELTEENRDILHYRIGGAGPAADGGVSLTLADLFGGLESLRTEFQLEDYSVCQTSLDHVFVRFASHQSDEPGHAPASEEGRNHRLRKGHSARSANQPSAAAEITAHDWDSSDRVSVAGSELSTADSHMNLIV